MPASRPTAPRAGGVTRGAGTRSSRPPACASPTLPGMHAGAVRWFPTVRSWWTRLDGDRDRDRDEAALLACQVSMLADASWIQTLGIPGAAVRLKGMRSSPRLGFARRQLLSVRTENIPVPPSARSGGAGEPRAALARGSRSPAQMLAAAETLGVAGTGGHGRVPGAPRCQPRGAAGRRFGAAQRLSKWQERSTAQTQECLFLFPIEFLFISCPYGYLFSPPLALWQGSRILMRRKLVKSQAFPGGRFGNERLV